MVPAPLGGVKTGKNPTDRAKSGAKIHLLVDERGAPLAIHITGANEHDKWSVDDLIFILSKRDPTASSIFVRIRATTLRTFSNLSKRNGMYLILSIVAGETIQKLRNVQFQEKRVFLHDVRSLKGRWGGWQNDVASKFAGAKNRKTGWHFSSSQRLTSSSI